MSVEKQRWSCWRKKILYIENHFQLDNLNYNLKIKISVGPELFFSIWPFLSQLFEPLCAWYCSCSNRFLLVLFQVKQLLRPLQRQQQQPPSLEDSRTTALPGRSTTGSRPLTTARQTLRRWVQHHKPLRYTRAQNLPCTFTYSQLFCTITPFLPQVFTGLWWLQLLHKLNQKHFSSLHRF